MFSGGQEWSVDVMHADDDSDTFHGGDDGLGWQVGKLSVILCSIGGSPLVQVKGQM